MRKPIPRTVILFALATPVLMAACAGAPESGASSTAPDSVFLECLCGTPEHDILGCTHECCLGGPSCGNLLCTCLALPRSDTIKKGEDG